MTTEPDAHAAAAAVEWPAPRWLVRVVLAIAMPLLAWTWRQDDRRAMRRAGPPRTEGR